MIKIRERFTKVIMYVSYKPTPLTCDQTTILCGGAASAATADGGDSPIHAISWATYGSSYATHSLFAIPPPLSPVHGTPVSMSMSV